MEYRVVSRVIHDHDFYEGVRAALIEKDKMPKWKPSQLETITDESINSYFAPFGNPRDELQLLSTMDYKFKSPRIGLFPTGFILEAVHEQGSTIQEVFHELYASKSYYFSPYQEDHIRSVLSRKLVHLPDGRFIRGRALGYHGSIDSIDRFDPYESSSSHERSERSTKIKSEL